MKNTHRVPAKQWYAWSLIARRVFNSVYEQMKLRQQVITHPDAPVIKPYHWRTVAWNAAWTAADAVDCINATVLRG